MSHLAEVEEKVEQVHAEQSSADFFTFSETIRDYVALLGAVKVSYNVGLSVCNLFYSQYHLSNNLVTV